MHTQTLREKGQQNLLINIQKSQGDKSIQLSDRGWEHDSKGRDEAGEVAREERKYYKGKLLKPSYEICFVTCMKEEITREF